MLLTFAMLVYVFIWIINNQTVEDDIYGNWSSENDYSTLEVSFDSSNDFQMNIIYPDTIGFNYSGKYKIDLSKKPIPCSFNINELDKTIYCSIKFIDKEKIRISNFVESWKLRELSIEHDNSTLLYKN